MSWGFEVYRSDGLLTLSSERKIGAILGSIHTTAASGSIFVSDLVNIQGDFFYAITSLNINQTTVGGTAIRTTINLNKSNGQISWSSLVVGSLNSFSFNYGVVL